MRMLQSLLGMQALHALFPFPFGWISTHVPSHRWQTKTYHTYTHSLDAPNNPWHSNPANPRHSGNHSHPSRGALVSAMFSALLFLMTSVWMLLDSHGGCAANAGRLPVIRLINLGLIDPKRVPMQHMSKAAASQLVLAPWDLCITADLATASGASGSNE